MAIFYAQYNSVLVKIGLAIKHCNNEVILICEVKYFPNLVAFVFEAYMTNKYLSRL